MSHKETVAEFKDRSDFNAICFALSLVGIGGIRGDMEKFITRFKNVREITISYNFRLLQRHVDEFHSKKRSG
jgi:hypothetical protein